MSLSPEAIGEYRSTATLNGHIAKWEILGLLASHDELQARVGKVRALHNPGERVESVIPSGCIYGECEHDGECPEEEVIPCVECSQIASAVDGGEYFIPYPCPTIRALDGSDQ